MHKSCRIGAYYITKRGGMKMFHNKMILLAAGGIALTAVAVVVAGLAVRKQTNKLRANMRSLSRGVYNFGTALQLLSGADAEDDCERSGCC
jgi:hypothetical protein